MINFHSFNQLSPSNNNFVTIKTLLCPSILYQNFDLSLSKAAGPNGICAMAFVRTGGRFFARQLQFCMEIVGRDTTDFLAWFVKGRTVLIPKQGCEGKAGSSV